MASFTVTIRPEAQQLAVLAADRIAACVAARPDAVLGTATGSSPLPLYAELSRRVEAGELDLSHVTGFMLDEYVGLPADHPERYATFMERNLRVPARMTPGSIHGPDALTDDLAAACTAYEEKMAAAGYCDLQILGIGTDGHIGFNEPGGPLDSRTHVGALAEQTRQDNARFFGGDVGAVPTHCITQGLATIMEARELLLIATGENKAPAIAQVLEGAVSEQWPATVLQRHSNVHLYLDPAAASLLSPELQRAGQG